MAAYEDNLTLTALRLAKQQHPHSAFLPLQYCALIFEVLVDFIADSFSLGLPLFPRSLFYRRFAWGWSNQCSERVVSIVNNEYAHE